MTATKKCFEFILCILNTEKTKKIMWFLLGLFIWFNAGTFLTNQYITHAYKNQTNWLQLKIDDFLYGQIEKIEQPDRLTDEEIVKRYQEEYTFDYILMIAGWPIFMLMFTFIPTLPLLFSWVPWFISFLWSAVKFIFNGGLVVFSVQMLAKIPALLWISIIVVLILAYLIKKIRKQKTA